MSDTQVFDLDCFIARRKFFKIFGGTFTIHEPTDMDVRAYVHQKAFKLKEDIRVFTDDTKSDSLLVIQARSVIDFSAAYDVLEPETNQKVGALRRKGFSSILRDRWQILDARDIPIGEIVEDSAGMAIARRFLSNLIPQKFHVDCEGKTIGTIKAFMNPFVLKYRVDFSMDKEELLDRRLGLAAVILLLAIEGRQQ